MLFLLLSNEQWRSRFRTKTNPLSIVPPEIMSKLQHDAYFYKPQESKPDYPLLVFLPGLDETGKDLMSRQTDSLESGFDVRCFVIPPEDIDDFDFSL